LREYLLIEVTDFSQDAWEETKDEKGRTLRPTRPARNEKLVTVRLDRQFTAKLRVPASTFSTGGRRKGIQEMVKGVSLGEEIAPGVQIVEYETRLTEAQPATVSPEKRDGEGNIVTPESYSPPVPERIDHVFTLRLNGRDLAKRELTDEEFNKSTWRSILARKASGRSETWIE